MCLYHSKSNSIAVATDFINNANSAGELTFYKVMDVSDRRATAPSRNNDIELNEDNYYVSNRTHAHLTAAEKHYGSVDYGIHVYRTREEAARQWSLGYSRFVLPVYAKLCDFVAAGHAEAVFTKVRINPDELRAAIRKVIADKAERVHPGVKNTKKRKSYLAARGPIVKYTKKK